ncbi:MAG: hypothetical protein RL520_2090 [Pseudomonadota bacterium]
MFCMKSLAWPPAPVCFLLRYRSQKHPRTDGPTDVLGKRATYFIVTALLE